MARPARPAAIPLVDGLAPCAIAIPQGTDWTGRRVLDFLVQRLPRVTRADWTERLARGVVWDEAAQSVPADALCQPGQRLYYHREWGSEPEPPKSETVVFQDGHLVVADKPPFMAVTPGGRHLRHSLLARLRRRLDLPELSPLHRIDRETAGLVVFSVHPTERDAYQRLFRERRVDKTYEAIAPWREDLRWPQTRCSHLLECEDAFYKMREACASENRAPNSETRIDCLERQGDWARYRLEPVTGQRHQLRVHMAALGLPIANDLFYPVVRHGADGGPDDPARPLALLAQTLAFEDPITGQPRRFSSQRRLAWP